MSERRRQPRPTCTHHCAGCGEHFASLAAFDWHLERQEDGTNWCVPPASVRIGRPPRDPYESRPGVCRLSGSAEPVEARIWADHEARVRAQGAFRRPSGAHEGRGRPGGSPASPEAVSAVHDSGADAWWGRPWAGLLSGVACGVVGMAIAARDKIRGVPPWLVRP